MAAEHPLPVPRGKALAPLLICLVGMGMLGYTWNTWPDSLYDFGSQLYYPWQIGQGKHLYTDIAYFRGPLSQYFNAALFAIMGVSLRTLVWGNLVILAGVTALIYRLLLAISGRLCATVNCLVLLLVFAFGQYVGIGNYNWICPYTHEVTHGAALSLAAIGAFCRLLKTGRDRWAFLTGILLGLSFLTTAEVFIPGAAAIGAGLILAFRQGRVADSDDETGRLFPTARTALTLIAGGLVPIAMAFGLMLLAMPPQIAGRAVLGSWPWLFDSRIAQLQFYRQGLGIDDIATNLREMFIISGGYCIAFALIAATARLQRRLRGLGPVMVCLMVVALVLFWQEVPWSQIARPWPLFMGIMSVFAFGIAWKQAPRRRRQQADERSSPWILRTVLCVFALGMLGKMALNARVSQYGFVLAMPAAMMLIDLLLGWLPSWMERHNGCPRTFRAGALVLIIAAVTVHLWVCHFFIDGKIYPVGQGADQFFAGTRGLEVDLARKAIEATVPPGGAIAVLPQGLMLNYLTRRPIPLHVVNLMPPELLSTGEEQTLADLKAHPPDLIILTRKDVDDKGFVLTEGHYEYGGRILTWIRANYTTAGSLKLPNDLPGELGFVFLKPRAASQ